MLLEVQNEQIIETGLTVTGALEEVASIKPSIYQRVGSAKPGCRLEPADEKIFIPNIIHKMVSVTVLMAAHPALGQIFSLDLGQGPSSTGRIIQLFILITVLSLAPVYFGDGHVVYAHRGGSVF